MSDVINLEVGQAAPKFSCLDSNGNNHSLEQYMNDGKSVILYFYPKIPLQDALHKHVTLEILCHV